MIARAHSVRIEQLHSAQPVLSGRCGVHVGTPGVGRPGGMVTGGIVGRDPAPAVIGAVGIPCGGLPVPGGIDPPGCGRDPAVPPGHGLPTQG